MYWTIIMSEKTSERYFLMWRLKKSIMAVFYREKPLPKPKIRLSKLDFHHIIWSKRLIHSKKTRRKLFVYRVWRKSLKPFLRYLLLVSCPVIIIPLPIFRFSPKHGKIMYTLIWYCVKFDVSIFIIFADMKGWIFPHSIVPQWLNGSALKTGRPKVPGSVSKRAYRSSRSKFFVIFLRNSFK